MSDLVLALSINGATPVTFNSYSDLKAALGNLETAHTYIPKVLEIVGEGNDELATWICNHRVQISNIRKTDKAAIQKKALELLKAAGIDAKNIVLPEPTNAQIQEQVVERLTALAAGNKDLYNVLADNLDALVEVFKRQVSQAALDGMAKFKADVETAKAISDDHGKVCRKMYKDYCSILENGDRSALDAFVARNV